MIPFWLGGDAFNRRKYFHRFAAGVLGCDAGRSPVSDTR